MYLFVPAYNLQAKEGLNKTEPQRTQKQDSEEEKV
jgi:hypothetical protein